MLKTERDCKIAIGISSRLSRVSRRQHARMPFEVRAGRFAIGAGETCSLRQCVTVFTEELSWLTGRDLELVMGDALCN
jgi:hypothetical protein